MRVRISVSPLLRNYVEIPETVEVWGNTVGGCLEDLFRQYPEAGLWVSERNVMMQIIIDVNQSESLLIGPDSLNRAVKEGDHLTLIGLIAGG
jgi:molybdopterin converting factor small subunit